MFRRQRRAPGAPRPFTHRVKVTAEQERILTLKAAERRITIARLLVESAMSGGADSAAAKAHLADELFRVTRLLGKIGVNINQIAKATNATYQVQPETQPALDAIVRTCARIDALLDAN